MRRGRADQWMDPWARAKDVGKRGADGDKRGRRHKKSTRSRGSHSSYSSSRYDVTPVVMSDDLFLFFSSKSVAGLQNTLIQKLNSNCVRYEVNIL